MDSLSTLFSQIGFERAAHWIGLTFGTFWGFAFGPEIAPLVWWLVVFVGLDFATGWLAAARNGTFMSSVMRAGIQRKITIFVICGLSHGLDVLFEPVIGISIFQAMILSMYGLGEFASILENLERSGYGKSIPPLLRRLIGAVHHRLEDTVEQIEGDKSNDKK